jgi:multidrug efflux pump subunit AcrA (membrane-fusion protein)
MSFLILFDLLARPSLDAALDRPEAAQTPAHRRTGLSLLFAALLFLVTFVLKDLPGNPIPDFTQKVFVLAELFWIVLAHAYAVFYVAPMREYFREGRPLRSDALVYSGLLVTLVFGFALASIGSPAQAAEGDKNIGGTGRIQPAGGVITLTGPHGHQVEQVLVQIGQRVRKGDVLLVLSDRNARVLERDLAEEKLRSLEQQSLAQRKVAELDVEAAQQMLSQAKESLAQIQGLDERTFSQKDKRDREYAVQSAQTSLRQANARLEEVKQRLDGDRKVLRRNLDLARVQLAATQVLAPRDATVIEVNVHPGATLGGAAVILADTSTMYVQGDFFEGDLPKLAPGQRVKVSNNALGAPLYGVMDRIGRVVDPVNRLVKAWVKLDQPKPAEMYIGMQVDLRIEGPAAKPSPRR